MKNLIFLLFLIGPGSSGFAQAQISGIEDFDFVIKHVKLGQRSRDWATTDPHAEGFRKLALLRKKNPCIRNLTDSLARTFFEEEGVRTKIEEISSQNFSGVTVVITSDFSGRAKPSEICGFRAIHLYLWSKIEGGLYEIRVSHDFSPNPKVTVALAYDLIGELEKSRRAFFDRKRRQEQEKLEQERAVAEDRAFHRLYRYLTPPAK